MTIVLDKKYATYVDWTCEPQPRAFYVGKGNQRRVNDGKRRNRYYANIVKKYGVRREIVFESDNAEEALQCEMQLILEHKTYVNGGSGFWGANMTLGGEGRNGDLANARTREKMSTSQFQAWQDEQRRAQASITQQQRWADETTRQKACIKYSEVWSKPELRMTMSETIKAATAKPEVKQRMSEGQKNMWRNMTLEERTRRCKAMSEAAQLREKNKLARNNVPGANDKPKKRPEEDTSAPVPITPKRR